MQVIHQDSSRESEKAIVLLSAHEMADLLNTRSVRNGNWELTIGETGLRLRSLSRHNWIVDQVKVRYEDID